jgi:hypothetical protein
LSTLRFESVIFLIHANRGKTRGDKNSEKSGPSLMSFHDITNGMERAVELEVLGGNFDD